MPTTITGTDGVSQVQTGAVESGDLPAGSVIQVVQNISSTGVQISSSNYQDSGLSLTITPFFSTSKILVIVNQCGNTVGTPDKVDTAIIRNSSIVYEQRQQSPRPGEVGSNDHRAITFDMCFLDSPNTTSALTYKTQGRFSGSGRIDFQKENYNGSIILMEIAG